MGLLFLTFFLLKADLSKKVISPLFATTIVYTVVLGMISITFLMLGAQNVRAEAREEDKTRSSLVPLTPLYCAEYSRSTLMVEATNSDD